MSTAILRASQSHQGSGGTQRAAAKYAFMDSSGMPARLRAWATLAYAVATSGSTFTCRSPLRR